MPFDLGDTVPLVFPVTDTAGAPANATTVVLTITLPDGTTATPAVTNPPVVTGTYTVTYTPTVEGPYSARWVATGTNPQALTDSFDVRSATPPLMFSLADAKTILNIATTTHDAKIRDLIESTTAAVEYYIGPVPRRTVVERYEPFGTDTIVLRSAPVISLTSIVSIPSTGVTYSIVGMDVDTDTGIVQSTTSTVFSGPIRVTYVAGRTTVPAGIRDAARIILKRLFEIHTGSAGLPRLTEVQDKGMTTIPGQSYPIPNQAIQLLQPYMRTGKFA